MMRSPLHTSVHKKLYEITDTTELWCRSLCIIIDRYLFDKIWYSVADQSSHSFCFLLGTLSDAYCSTNFLAAEVSAFSRLFGGEFLTLIFFFTVLFTPTKFDERVYVYTTYISNIRYYIFFPLLFLRPNCIYTRALIKS